MFKLKLKLKNQGLSRTIHVPENITFKTLDDILRQLFSFSYFHLSKFNFPALNASIWDYSKTGPDSPCMDMESVNINEYFIYFKKFTWTYDLSKSYEFNVNILKSKKDLSYPFVEDFECEFNPIEDCHPIDFKEMLYYKSINKKQPDWLPDFELEEFNINSVNKKFKG